MLSSLTFGHENGLSIWCPNKKHFTVQSKSVANLAFEKKQSAPGAEHRQPLDLKRKWGLETEAKETE